MAELKSLQDFYNPSMAMAGLNYQVNQQHLALQQQQVENQNKNMQIDNLRQALSVANPMESYPLVKQLMEMNGQQAPAVNEYYANPDTYRTLLTNKVGSPEHTEALQTWLKASPSSRGVVEKEMNSQLAQQGAGEFLEKAGVPNSEATRQLAVGSQAVMSQVTDAIAMNALQKEHSERVQAANKEHQAFVTRISPETDVIDTLSTLSKRQLENIQPILPKMQKIDAEFQKDIKSLGMNAAQKKREAKISIDPELAEYEDRRKSKKIELTDGLKELHNQEDALTIRINKIVHGTDTLKEGESIELLNGRLAEIGHKIDYTKAALGVAQGATQGSVKEFAMMKEKMDAHRKLLLNAKLASEQGLELRKASFDATQAERVAKHDLQNRQALGEAELLEAVRRGENVDDAAARIGRQRNVAPSAIKEALKDPNRPPLQVQMFDPKQSVTQAGQLVNLTQSVREIGEVRKMVVDPDTGEINRAKLFAADLNLAFSKGRDINSFMEKAVEIKLRAATGAAAPPAEVKKYLRIFSPATLDSGDLIKYKLDALEEWMQSTADISDPLGSLRERADKLLSPGISDVMKSPEYQSLRKMRPNASVRDIVRFLEAKKKKDQ